MKKKMALQTPVPLGSPVQPKQQPKLLLKSINVSITCNLCEGYLIDATTLIECLHSCKFKIFIYFFVVVINLFFVFSNSTVCHSCIMKHMRTEQYCPRCEILINKHNPKFK